MWTDVKKTIERLLQGKDLSVDAVNQALGVDLALTLDTPAARHYRAEISSGPFHNVELRLIPETGVSFLVLRSDPTRPTFVAPNDLRIFGTPKSRSVEPKAGPEGQVGECYALPKIELRVGYRAKSRQLEAISLEAKA
jgi:hypothetical protein